MAKKSNTQLRKEPQARDVRSAFSQNKVGMKGLAFWVWNFPCKECSEMIPTCFAVI